MQHASLHVTRVRIIVILFVIFIALLVSKLYLVQIVNSERYSDRADRQYVRPQSGVLDRGTIAFTRKDGTTLDAATLQTGYTVAINPSIMEHPEDAFNALSFVLDLEEEEYLSRAGKSDDPYEEIAKRVPKDIAEQIEELDIDGVTLVKEKWRFYPGETLAAHVLGFMAYSGDEVTGQYGIERQYNEVLRRDDSTVYANFFVELFSGFKETFSDESSRHGSVVTTIDPEVQTFVEAELAKVRSDWNSKTVGAIVMDPMTGAIVSMGLNPTFDLNDFGSVEDVHTYSNGLVEDVYEMGSIVKPLTMAIGLDTNAVTPESTYNDTGSMTLDGWTFYNFDKRSRGVVNMQDVLNNSLNTGVATVVQRVGKNTFRDYMKKLFGDMTAIDLPFEASPLISNLDSPRDIEYANASFGQGIAITPIAMTRALAALGNGGYLVTPHIAKEIDYEVGLSKNIEPTEKIQIFSEQTSETISRMLMNVVDEALRGGDVALPHHSIGAKTGTAQIAKPDGTGYYDDRYLHSFFGYFPVFEPRFIVFMYNVEPVGARYASETLTEPFMNIAEFLINYYDISPDR